MDRMSLGQFIVAKRKQMVLTQEELARKMNVSKSAVAKWERDGGVPDRDNLYKLAEIFGVSVEDMYHIIRSKNYKDMDLKVNITPEVISLLESYGYIVVRPEEKKEDF